MKSHLFLSVFFTIHVVASSYTLFPRLRCLYVALVEMKLQQLQTDGLAEFLREDSLLSYAPAGNYFGPDAIVEYVHSATAVSPYYKSGPNITAVQVNPVEFDQDTDICMMSADFIIAYESEPTLVGDDYKYRVGITFKFFIDIREKYITQINAHFAGGYLDLLTNYHWVTPQAIDFVCGIMETLCVDIYGEDVYDVTNCRERYAALPNSTGPDNYIDGDSKGCRALHSAFTVTNPEGHCAHLSFDPLMDPKGAIKCQESDGRSVLDLFTQSELDRFDAFQVRQGLDPNVGHDFDLCGEFGVDCP